MKRRRFHISGFVCLAWLLTAANAEGGCNQVVPLQTCSYNVSWKWEPGESGIPTDGFILQRNGVDFLTNIAPDLRSVAVGFQDTGYQNYKWELYAFNAEGRSGPSNPQTVTSAPIMSLITLLNFTGIVTTSRRSTDTSSIVSILVNANQQIGPNGLVITYPPGITLLTSRRATSTSSVIAILVNKSTVVTLNPDP
jgi:hypothetical protein